MTISTANAPTPGDTWVLSPSRPGRSTALATIERVTKGKIVVSRAGGPPLEFSTRTMRRWGSSQDAWYDGPILRLPRPGEIEEIRRADRYRSAASRLFILQEKVQGLSRLKPPLEELEALVRDLQAWVRRNDPAAQPREEAADG